MDGPYSQPQLYQSKLCASIKAERSPRKPKVQSPDKEPIEIPAKDPKSNKNPKETPKKDQNNPEKKPIEKPKFNLKGWYDSPAHFEEKIVKTVDDKAIRGWWSDTPEKSKTKNEKKKKIQTPSSPPWQFKIPGVENDHYKTQGYYNTGWFKNDLSACWSCIRYPKRIG